jgi:hypothetical protein
VSVVASSTFAHVIYEEVVEFDAQLAVPNKLEVTEPDNIEIDPVIVKLPDNITLPALFEFVVIAA